MYTFTCKQCNHINKVDPSVLNISVMDGWENLVDPVLRDSLGSGGTYQSLTPKLPDGSTGRTLFLSIVVSNPLSDILTNNTKDLLDYFKEAFVPAFKTIAENFTIIGNLVPPSYTTLATADLSDNFAIFCFPIIRNVPDLETKLASLGFRDLLLKGNVGSLGYWPKKAPKRA